jgi:hypothetical protein
MMDWLAEQLRAKERIEAAEQGMERLRRRRREVAAWLQTTKDVAGAPERIRDAARCAREAQLAAVDQLQRAAEVHGEAARVHEQAAQVARTRTSAIEHRHIAEVHRSSAKHDLSLANQYRERAEDCDSE